MGLTVKLKKINKNAFRDAEANSGDQRLSSDGEKKGRQVGQDQEEQGKYQVQGTMQPLSVHVGGPGSGKGGEAEAVSSSRPRRQRTQINVKKPGKKTSFISFSHVGVKKKTFYIYIYIYIYMYIRFCYRLADFLKRRYL